MGWFITADTEEFLAVAGEYLRAEPARNTVVLTVTEDLRVKAPARAPDARAPAAAPGSGPDEPLFGWWRPPACRDAESAGPVGAVAGMARVGPVHTPPELRGRGYAGAVTAAVSQEALDARSSGRWCSTPTWPTPRVTPCTSVLATARWRNA